MIHYIQYPTADGGTILVEVFGEEQFTDPLKAGLEKRCMRA